MKYCWVLCEDEEEANRPLRVFLDRAQADAALKETEAERARIDKAYRDHWSRRATEVPQPGRYDWRERGTPGTVTANYFDALDAWDKEHGRPRPTRAPCSLTEVPLVGA